MGDKAPRPPSKKIEVVLRDLDVLLRKELGKNLIVDNFTTSNLVPLGENYGSTMLRVDAEVRIDGPNSEPERLSFVAKMTPPTEFQKVMFDSPFTFPKEIYMFTEIVPAYKALEREYGVPETEVFDPIPKLYGSRLSLDETGDKFDHDAVILMENLKVKNYTCGDRRIGVDLEHAKLIVKTLAHFHALGIALKLKKPDSFEKIKKAAESMEFKEDMMKGVQESIMNDAKKIPALLPYLSRIENIVFADASEVWLKTPEEPWASIVHTDFWINNVMFRDDENGKPVDVKLIDFQNYLYQNPARDLVFFIFSSCIKEVRVSHAENLIDLYYEKLISHLARLECDLNSFSRDSFDKQVTDAASVEFVHCVLMAKVILTDAQADPSAANPEILFDKKTTDECLELMTEIALMFVEKNWI